MKFYEGAKFNRGREKKVGFREGVIRRSPLCGYLIKIHRVLKIQTEYRKDERSATAKELCKHTGFRTTEIPTKKTCLDTTQFVRLLAALTRHAVNAKPQL